MNQRYKSQLPMISVILLVALMVGMSELLQEKEIVFPEITALAVGAILAPTLSWRTSRIRMLILIAVCSVFGLCMVVFVPLPVWTKIIIGYMFCQILFLYSGTSFAPMISAAILPILMGTESIIYPFSACGFTLMIIIVEAGMIRLGVKEKEQYVPMDKPDGLDWRDAVLRLAIVTALSMVCLPLGIKFCIAPPILVAFTEFTRKGNKARKQPVKAVLIIAGCAAGGAISRFLICGILDFPLTAAAVTATIVMIIILKNSRMYLPPAGALAILAMIIPEEMLLRYPIQVLTGTAVLLCLAIMVFPEAGTEIQLEEHETVSIEGDI